MDAQPCLGYCCQEKAKLATLNSFSKSVSSLMLPQGTPAPQSYSHMRRLVLIHLAAWLWLAAQPALLLLLGVVPQPLPLDRHT